MKKPNDIFGDIFDPFSHDPVPSDNESIYCREISLLWGLIKIKA